MRAQRAFQGSTLSPPITNKAMLDFEKLADIKAVAKGSYPQLEFTKVCFTCHLELGEEIH
jgi:hypothetical protein